MGPVTRETARQSASWSSSITRRLKFGVMVESTIVTWYPARRSGVDTARMPNGAVASWLEKAGKKKTTFFLGAIDAPFTFTLPGLSHWKHDVWGDCKN